MSSSDLDPREPRDASDADAIADVPDLDAIVDGEEDEGGTDDDEDDDEIVLAWWQHPLNVVVLVVASLLIGGLAGWMVGDSSGVAHNGVDTGFLHDMREHHEQAIDMAWIYSSLPDTDAGLQIVAGAIIQGQTIEVGRMIQLLRDFGEDEANFGETSMAWMGAAVPRGEMPGMASEQQLQQLAASSGADADQLFAQLMIAHHQGGIHMAEYARDHGKSAEVAKFAESVVGGQQGEIAEIERELAN